MVDNTVFLFTYGTLKRGEPGHELMVGARFIATVMKSNLKWVQDAGYPSCIETDSTSDTVTGEIWEIATADLPLLDEYEGSNYKRVMLRNSHLYAYVLNEQDADQYADIV